MEISDSQADAESNTSNQGDGDMAESTESSGQAGLVQTIDLKMFSYVSLHN